MEENQTNRTVSKNMFSEVLNDKYAERFIKIYYANIQDKDDLVNQLYEDAKQDESLNDEQKRIINTCILAYNQATGKSNMCIPILAFMKNNKPNLFKILNSNTRSKRAIWQLNDFVELTGFDFNVFNIHDYISSILFLTKTEDIDARQAYNTTAGFNIMALVQYSRNLSEEHIATKWFIMCYLKFIQDISGIIYNKELLSSFYSRISSIIKTFNYVLYIAYENAGKSEELKDFLKSIKEYKDSKDMKINEVEI